MIKACVIGWPIAHSRSPLIHSHWLKSYGISGTYGKEAVAPENLQAFFQSLKQEQLAGCNVTIPHKETALALVDEPDDRARRIGALNTVWLESGVLRATSTDGPGFVANVSDVDTNFQWAASTATILGAGGSARAIIDELLRQQVSKIYVYNRTLSRAENLSHHFGPQVHAIEQSQLTTCLSATDLLINTTSQGMNADTQIDLPWRSLKPSAVVADIVYTPLITPFLTMAAARDHRIVPGLGMLLHQAVIGFEKWFGVKPHVTPALYDLVAKDIDPDYLR